MSTVILSLIWAAASAGADLSLSEELTSMTQLVWPQAVALADITGDHVLDAVVIGNTSVAYAVLPGIGDGTFGPASASGALNKGPSDCVVADFDEDGDLDIAVINNACT